MVVSSKKVCEWCDRRIKRRVMQDACDEKVVQLLLNIIPLLRALGTAVKGSSEEYVRGEKVAWRVYDKG
jgi:hypothetical protein